MSVSPIQSFLIRLVAALAGSYLMSAFFFGRVVWANVLLLAAFILLVAYGLKAIRGQRGNGS